MESYIMDFSLLSLRNIFLLISIIINNNNNNRKMINSVLETSSHV